MKFEFPNKGDITQMNKGEAYGSLNHSYGIDFSSEKGRILNSPGAITHLNGTTTGTFGNQVVSFHICDSRWIGIANNIYRSGTSTQDPTAGWSIDVTASTPTVTVAEGDGTMFDGNLYVSGIAGAGDIYKYTGSAWSSWWQGTLAQAALSSNYFKPLKVGPSGRLYILDDMNKVYNVTTTGTVTKTGNGTLDMSSTGYRFLCMVMSSNRMWLGGRDLSTGESVVAEWDMSLNESTVNRYYFPGASGVNNILIWNDSPVLMLNDGSMRFYDGSKFYEEDNARLVQTKNGKVYSTNYYSTSILGPEHLNIHPNGSAVIDDMPHFLMSAIVRNTTPANTIDDDYRVVAGVFCYDPEIGLYNRFPIETVTGTNGFGTDIKNLGSMGALSAAPSPKTSFIASAMIWNEQEAYEYPIIFSDDRALTAPARGRFVLNPFYGTAKDLWQKVEVLSTRLKDSSDRILLKYRLFKDSNKPFKADVTWLSTTSFRSSNTDFQYVNVGDFVLGVYDYGGNCSAHVSAITYSSPNYTITLDEAFLNPASTGAGVVRVDNFRRLATISNQQTDYHDISVQNTGGSHTFWLMVELRAAAGSVVELDKIIVTSNDGK